MTTPPSSLILFTIPLITILLAVTVGKLRRSPDTIAECLINMQGVPAADIHTHPDAVAQMSTDYGLLTRAAPAAVLHPSTPDDIAALVRLSHSLPHPFPVSARGNGQSIRGQTLAPGGVVVNMRSLQDRARYKRINVSTSSPASGSYVDAGGEQLWIDVLRESLVHGLAPRSWTDYLYMSVGGTLSNAGLSGQAFRSGPQISNVYELDVIIGTGEMVTCSPTQNPELFYGVLGGLGQFGIITRARIPIVPAPVKVRWLRLMYTDFASFTRDEEFLIGMDDKGFDYVEGLLLLDHTLIDNWKSTFFSDSDMKNIANLAKEFGTIYCLEGAVYYFESDTASSVDQELGLLLKRLSFAPGFAFSSDVSYTQFLDRVHDDEESSLRSLGLWEVPHPWINIFVPRSRIQDIETGVIKGILKGTKFKGPLLVYPMNKNKWDERTSVMLPDEDVFYTVELLRFADVDDDWQFMDDQNDAILRFCDQQGIKYKQYLPYFTSQDEWAKHYGPKWDKFVELKKKYDPKAIMSPGQKIFTPSSLE